MTTTLGKKKREQMLPDLFCSLRDFYVVDVVLLKFVFDVSYFRFELANVNLSVIRTYIEKSIYYNFLS